MPLPRRSDARRLRAVDESDDALVAAARDGDRSAAERLLQRHHDRIASLCRRLAGNPEDAADCTQEALIAVLRGLPRFDGRSAFTTWCHRVTTNACLDELRRRSRRPVPREVQEDLDPAPAPGPEGGGAARVDIDRALSTLPLEFRIPVVLRDLCGLDYAEIAEICAIPGGTVRSRIARGRRDLARILGGPEDRPGNPKPLTDVEGGDHDRTDR